MKTFILILIISLSLMSCVTAQRSSNKYNGEIRHYDNRGSYTGKSVEYNYDIRHYNARGEYVGKSYKY